ncbi:hypothetical protein ZWY2020_007591 [Hordeum vulgare]|nr:hypothetical protein ZWY2020_007591 [Hordeum vulgare]
MPSWNDEESLDENICVVSMDQQLFETSDSVMDTSFCGFVTESEPKCMMHREMPKKMDEGVNCGVVEWVDVPWPEILQRCLARIWDMYHEQNLGRVNNKQAHEKGVGKLKKEIDFLAHGYKYLVNDVSNLFDYQDGKMSHDMDTTSQAINELNEKKKQLEDQANIEIQMEKLKLAKEQRGAGVEPLVDGPLENVDPEPLGGAREDLGGTAVFLYLFALGGSGGTDEAGLLEIWC